MLKDISTQVISGLILVILIDLYQKFKKHVKLNETISIIHDIIEVIECTFNTI